METVKQSKAFSFICHSCSKKITSGGNGTFTFYGWGIHFPHNLSQDSDYFSRSSLESNLHQAQSVNIYKKHNQGVISSVCDNILHYTKTRGKALNIILWRLLGTRVEIQQALISQFSPLADFFLGESAS